MTTTVDMHALARLGATLRYREVEAEIARLRQAFPDLVAATPAPAPATAPARRGLSWAARRATSRRMKKYWAQRRAAKK